MGRITGDAARVGVGAAPGAVSRGRVRRPGHAIVEQVRVVLPVVHHGRDDWQVLIEPKLPSGKRTERLAGFRHQRPPLVHRRAGVRLFVIGTDRGTTLAREMIVQDLVALALVRLNLVAHVVARDPAAVDGEKPAVHHVELDAGALLIATATERGGHHGHTFRQNRVAFDPLELRRPVEAHRLHHRLECEEHAVVLLEPVEVISAEVDCYNIAHHGAPSRYAARLQRSAVLRFGGREAMALRKPTASRPHTTPWSDAAFRFTRKLIRA